mgnify:CR=1 FL=1
MSKMSEKIKGLIWFVVIFCIFAVGAELMAEEDYNIDMDTYEISAEEMLTAEDSVEVEAMVADGGPVIKDFEIIKNEEEDMILEFSFHNIKGGLAEAKFTVGYVIKRNGLVMEENVATDLSIASDLAKTAGFLEKDDFEEGTFQAIIPKEFELKTGEEIEYLLFLRDKTGRKSNTIIYEYNNCVGEWKI